MFIEDGEYTIKEGKVVSIEIYGNTHSAPRNSRNNRQDRQSSKSRGKNNNSQQRNTSNPKRRNSIYDAKAPYNFIPLANNIIPLKREKGNLNGYIDISITSKTPIFTRGKESSSVKDKKCKVNDFFKINNIPALPGSTLRGMLNSLVEIVAFGRFHFYDDKTYFYRRTDYDNLRFKAGFLTFESGVYKIYPCQYKPNDQSRSNREFDYQFNDSGCEFTTGKVRGIKKWVFYKNNKNTDHYTILKESKLFTDYESDKTRGEKVPNVFKCASKGNIKHTQLRFGMPVFFTENSGDVDYISHCKLGRNRYKRSVKDHIPQELRDDNSKTDFVDCIFGTTDFSGKIAVEDALLENTTENYYLDKYKEFLPKILASPKATAYQMYLEPNSAGRAVDWGKQLGSELTQIRGHKMYWHKTTPDNGNGNSWNENVKVKDSHNNFIKPLKSNLTFKGRVRFENMTELELGALLTAIELKDNMHHKLGLGKPLGLGTVKIVPRLTIINKSKRYNTLFDNTGNWELGEDKEESTSKYIQKFQNHMCSELKSEQKSFWEIPRIKELKTLLKFDEHNERDSWIEKREYMELGTFKSNKILPKPSEVQ